MPPPHHRTAAVLAVGDELVLGQTLDTNSQRLSAILLDRGVRVHEHTTVADDRAALARAITRLALGHDLLIITGGLGPTADDLTRHALADAMSEPLVEDAEALAHITGWFASRGRTMPPTNAVQALRPASSACIPNPHGTAPGLHAVLGDADVYCLPGPPREMEPMLEGHLLPALRPDPGRAVRTRVLKTFGLGESEIARRLGPMMDRDRAMLVGTTASMGIVSIRMRFEGPPAEAEGALAEADRAVRALVEPYIIGASDAPLGQHALDLLASRSETLAAAESCTGGMVASLMTDVPGSSAVFVASLVTYTNAMKQDLLGVPAALFNEEGRTGRPGAVSREVAVAMAEGARRRTGADHALAITGIAGPSGATPDKPVGTVWIAHARPGGAGADPDTEARRFAFRGDRAAIRTWSAHAALGLLLLDRCVAPSTPLVAEWPP